MVMAAGFIGANVQYFPPPPTQNLRLRWDRLSEPAPPFHPVLSGRENPIHPLSEIARSFDRRRLIARLLRDSPAAVSGTVQRLHNRRPVGAAIHQFGTVS